LSSELESIAGIFNLNVGRFIRLNDTSLEWGGLFDLNNNWTVPPHRQHRVGIHADVEINSNDVLGSCRPMTLSEKNILVKIITSVQGRPPLNEGDHFHLNRSLN
jgi:hypothetical protein